MLAPTPTRLQHPAALFAVAFTVSMVIAGTVGYGIGALTYAQGTSNCTPSDGWCEFGAAIGALLVGLAIGTIAYIVVGAVTIFRCRPSGSRSSHVVAHLVFPIAAFISLGVIGNLLG